MVKYFSPAIWILFFPVLLSAEGFGERFSSHRFIFDSLQQKEQAGDHIALSQKAAGDHIVFYEGFEEQTANGALPEGWEVKRTASLGDDPVDDAAWPHWFRNSLGFDGFTNPAHYIHEGAASLGIGWFAEDFTWAISPAFSIPDVSNDITLSYWHWFLNDQHEGEMYYSKYHVMVHADDQWHLLQSFIGNDDNTNLFDTPVFLGMNAYKGKDVRIAFVYKFNEGWQMAIDEIQVSKSLELDFGVRNLAVSPVFGILPGDEVDLTFKVFSNSEIGGTVNVSLIVNGYEEKLQPSGNLTGMGAEEAMRFTWVPQDFGHYRLEIMLPFDEYIGNNSISKEIYVNHHHALAEDFENFSLDGLGFPVFEFPPPGWLITDAGHIMPTLEYQIEEQASALMMARHDTPEHALITLLVSFGDGDEWLRFWVKGMNNNIYVDPNQYPGAHPPGVQGFSSLQVRYAESPECLWTDLGDIIEFKHIYNDQGQLIQSGNALRMIEFDVSQLAGEYHLGFFHTSSFELTIHNNLLYSYVVMDNIMVGNDPPKLSFQVRQSGGASVPGAVIHVFDEENNRVRALTTTSQGLASSPLTTGTFSYKVMKQGYSMAAGSFNINEDDVHKEVYLSIPDNLYTIDFQVYASNNRPAANTLVMISSFTGLTDENGQLQVDGLSDGTYSYSAYLSGYDTYFENLTIDGQDVSKIIYLDGVTGIDGIQPAFDLLLYPNPARDRVTIESEEVLLLITVFDIIGRNVYSISPNLKSMELDLSAFKTGYYIIKATSSGGAAVQKLHIVR